jgi:hypothetical protein
MKRLGQTKRFLLIKTPKKITALSMITMKSAVKKLCVFSELY